MKKWIHASTKKFDGSFGHRLFTTIKQFLPKNCDPRITPRDDVITVFNCLSQKKLVNAATSAVEALGCGFYYESEPSVVHVINGDKFIDLEIDIFPDNEDMNKLEGDIFINYVNSNPLFEDWYEDYEEQ